MRNPLVGKAIGAAVCFLCLSSTWAQNWTTVKLNSAAVTNASGAIIVLGTDTNVWTTGMTKEAVFDGSTNTYFDTYQPSNAWAGFQLQSAKAVTRIRYCGYTGRESRMLGARFEGSTNADFSNASTLWTHTPPSGWAGDTWIDVTLTNAFQLTSFTYLRFLATATNSCGGSVREVEFYGVDAITNAPSVPVMAFADSANWYAHLRWSVVSNAMIYEVQRKLADETAFSTVLTDCYRSAGAYTWRDPKVLYADTQYRVRALSPAGNSDWYNFTAVARNAATGTLFGVDGSYMTNGMTYAKLYDANIDTFFDGIQASNGNNLWSAIDMGQIRTLTGIRFAPRREFPVRMNGGVFQAASGTNFSDAVTLYTVSVNPPTNFMTEVVLSTPVSCRYVRYLSPNGGWGNAAEIEFDLAPAAPAAPTGLAATSSDITNDFPVFTWSYVNYSVIASSCVYRATAPGGPYTAQTPAGICGRTWADTNLQVGVLYYYKVSALGTNSTGGMVESPLSAYITWQRAARIERDWSNLTAVKSGMTVFQIGSNYGNSGSVGADKVFDGSLSTFADIVPSACSLGVDLGKPCAVKFMRFSPRSACVYRVNGAVLCGSNDLSSAATTLATFANGAANVYTVNYTTNTSMYRYVYATRFDGAEFYGNLAELEYYGWSADALTNVLTATASVAVSVQADGSLAIAWTPSTNAASYRVERARDDGSNNWVTVGTPSTTNLTDAAVVAGVRYIYRVVSIRMTASGEETAYSESFAGVTYTPGTGAGLTGTYTINYTKDYRADETIALVATNASIDLSWASGSPLVPGVAASATNVMVSWTGKLIVPFDGTYTFYVTSDDGAALRIDNQFVINEWFVRSAVSSNTVTLAAGQHDIRLDYYQATGSAAVRLEWGGPVLRAVIPLTQLVPGGAVSESDGPWTGRTFNTPKLGAQVYSTSNDAIAVYSAGLDLSGAVDGHHFVWQRVGGSFLIEAKINQTVDPNSLSAKALLMARNSLATGSPFIAPARMATGQLGCKGRTTSGGSIADMLSPAWQLAPSNPCWLRLQRVGNTFTAQYKNSGGDWATFFTFVDTNGVFSPSMVVGLSVTSPTYSTAYPLQSATFSEIRLAPLYGTIIQMR